MQLPHVEFAYLVDHFSDLVIEVGEVPDLDFCRLQFPSGQLIFFNGPEYHKLCDLLAEQWFNEVLLSNFTVLTEF